MGRIQPLWQPAGEATCGPALYLSLGTSPALVAEAYLLPGVQFQAVHVLTTEKPEVEPVRELLRPLAPHVPLTLTRVEGFTDLRSAADHDLFEEVLVRWFLAFGTPSTERYVCLSGGFKTMSAAMQKCAELLGAAEIFHVLADEIWVAAEGRKRPPQTIEEILVARKEGRLHYIRLGPEPGWPQFRSLSREEFPLEVVSESDGVQTARAPGAKLRSHIRSVLERSHNLARAWERLPELPFSVLATWSDAALSWLDEPLNPEDPTDRAWLAALPKLELHCHLGGFATHGRLLEQVRAAARRPDRLPRLQPCDPPAGWPLPSKPVDLRTYMRLGNNNGSALLRDPGCLAEHCRLLYEHLLSQRILYAEIRCSPANYADPSEGRSPWDVLQEIRAHFQACMDQARAKSCHPFACHVNLILIATRKEAGDYRAHMARHLALAVTAAEHWTNPGQCRVVGVDLAGYEDVTTRAHYFREEFTAIHRCGLALTVHAGENDDAEGIWRAVFDLNARRLGHALSLAESPDLLRSVADRGIGVELCPYANFQIKGFPLTPSDSVNDSSVYPLLRYLRAGLRVSINTDNIGISAASLTENLHLAARLCPGLKRLDVLWLQRHAIETAFYTAAERLALADQYARFIPQP
ncbi:MAG: CRISPR-associated ring nuclease [Verrucomicrobiota bacterium]|nr:CRISPR-associated ring nuclease [Limisphaera sp.]MDW8381480.1 CRISPR-associated ring nuclease [Verrucomicrobiota bacterium]